MSKFLVTTVFAIFTLLALTIIFMGTGWFLIVFIIVMPPAMVLHFLAWYRAINRNPRLYGWIILSSTIFLVFSLFRLDKDEHGLYNGYNTVMYLLGKSGTPPMEPWQYSLEVSLLLILGMIILDAVILRKAVSK